MGFENNWVGCSLKIYIAFSTLEENLLNTSEIFIKKRCETSHSCYIFSMAAGGNGAMWLPKPENILVRQMARPKTCGWQPFLLHVLFETSKAVEIPNVEVNSGELVKSSPMALPPFFWPSLNSSEFLHSSLSSLFT